MTMVDLVAASAAGCAGVCLALRGYMLKPAYATWASAPNAVAMGLQILAIALGGVVVSILGGASATAREAAVYAILAVVAAVMLWNVNRQRIGRDELERAARDRSDLWPI